MAANGINIYVSAGNGSEAICYKLQSAGLIDDASSFNAFLCMNGYDRRLTTGGHIVPVGSTYEEIARIMTTKYTD